MKVLAIFKRKKSMLAAFMMVSLYLLIYIQSFIFKSQSFGMNQKV